MAYTPLAFTKNWNDAGDFPAYESSEAQVRADMQELHSQTQTYLNETLLPELEAGVLSGRTFLDRTAAVSDWAADDTHEQFPYKADISCPGVTIYDVPIVTFRDTDADSALFAPLACADTDCVRIYAAEIPAVSITVPSIFCVKGGG